MDASGYDTMLTGIAFKLMLQASKDMFESEMWAYVARYAGDGDVLTRYKTRASLLLQICGILGQIRSPA